MWNEFKKRFYSAFFHWSTWDTFFYYYYSQFTEWKFDCLLSEDLRFSVSIQTFSMKYETVFEMCTKAKRQKSHNNWVMTYSMIQIVNWFLLMVATNVWWKEKYFIDWQIVVFCVHQNIDATIHWKDRKNIVNRTDNKFVHICQFCWFQIRIWNLKYRRNRWGAEKKNEEKTNIWKKLLKLRVKTLTERKRKISKHIVNLHTLHHL